MFTRQTKFKKYLYGLLVHLGHAFPLLVSGACGSGTPLGGEGDLKPFLFAGIESKNVVFNKDEGTYTLSWTGPEEKVGFYYIYKRTENEKFNFTKPLAETRNTTYTTTDLRFEDKSCFVVRFAPGKGEEQDNNTKEVCTSHEKLSFAGLASLERQSDGNYLLKWQGLPVNGITYHVYGGLGADLATVNYTEPISSTPENYFRFDNFALGEKRCFAVRFAKTGLPSDSNTRSLCTDENAQVNFAGVEAAIPLDVSAIKLSWKRSSHPAVAGYAIYIYRDVDGRRSFERKKTVGQPAAQSDLVEEVVKELPVGEIYHFGVRVLDASGHEDLNEKTMCVKVLGAENSKTCPST